MKIEDISSTRPAVLPDCIVIPGAVASCREPPEETPSSGTQVEEYVLTPTPQPPWPRVFPGL